MILRTFLKFDESLYIIYCQPILFHYATQETAASEAAEAETLEAGSSISAKLLYITK